MKSPQSDCIKFILHILSYWPSTVPSTFFRLILSKFTLLCYPSPSAVLHRPLHLLDQADTALFWHRGLLTVQYSISTKLSIYTEKGWTNVWPRQNNRSPKHAMIWLPRVLRNFPLKFASMIHEGWLITEKDQVLNSQNLRE